MKAHHTLLIPALFTALLFGCQLGGAWLGTVDEGGSTLPADLIADQPRAYAEEFQFQTLLPVDLSLSVRLYAPASRALVPLAPEEHLVIVTLTDSQGNPVYSGRAAADGTLQTTLSLPAAAEDLVLTLQAPGFETRTVTIRDMVELSAVIRTMGMLQNEAATRSLELSDRDLDGIPDVYDAYPDDPELAFSVREPADGYLTVAYEDLYPVPGDADYNDFVAKYLVVANYKNMVEVGGKGPISSVAALKTLHGEFTAVAKVAGYNHMFGMAIDYPGITPSALKVSYCDAGGTLRTAEPEPTAGGAIIWLFMNTKYAVGQTASFDITFPDGVKRDQVSAAPYDPVLKVLQLDPGKSYDIHLIGEDPLPLSPDRADETFMDANGYPWALLVPDDWQHPEEAQYIGEAYPFFDRWRKAEGKDFAYWYLYPALADTEPGNSAPHGVSGPTSAPMFATGTPASFQLDIAAPLGEADDPNNDKVYFRSSPAPAGLVGKVTLDEEKPSDQPDSGLVSFSGDVAEGTYVMYFWSEDEHGASTIAKPYKVSFTFQAGQTGNPRIVIETFSPNGSFTADTYIDLFDAGGDPDADDPWSGDDRADAIAWDDNGSTHWANMSRIDLTGGLEPGTYYIRVRGSTALYGIDDWYAIRVVVLPAGDPLPPYPILALAAKPDEFEVDDNPSSGGIPGAAVAIDTSTPLSRSLHRDGSTISDVDWFVLVLP